MSVLARIKTTTKGEAPMKHKVIFQTETGYREILQSFEDFIGGKNPEKGGKMVIHYETKEIPIFDLEKNKVGSRIVAASKDEKEDVRLLEKVARTKGLLAKQGRGFLVVYSSPEKNARNIKRLEFFSSRALRNENFPKHPRNFDEALLKIISLSRAINKAKGIVGHV
jgi:hypothetical protein